MSIGGMEEELNGSSLKSFTGQSVVMSPNARNVEDFEGMRGRTAMIEMSPVCAMERFLGGCESGEVK
jgi:hypothetical protein